MQVTLRNPRRVVDVSGPVKAGTLLDRLEIHRDTVLVIRNATLVSVDTILQDSDDVEIRPVISGGHA